MKQIKGIKLGAMLAVMLFLGVVMAPVVNAQTDTLIQDEKPVRTLGGTGLGSHIDSYLSGKGVINSSTVLIPSPVLRSLECIMSNILRVANLTLK
jgi:hypothetical protein